MNAVAGRCARRDGLAAARAGGKDGRIISVNAFPAITLKGIQYTILCRRGRPPGLTANHIKKSCIIIEGLLACGLANGCRVGFRSRIR